MSTNHTPTPWAIRNRGKEACVYAPRCAEHTGRVTAVTYEAETGWAFGGRDECDANAAFIVRACNAHDALVDALSAMLTANNMVDDEHYRAMDAAEKKARAALMLAKGDA